MGKSIRLQRVNIFQCEKCGKPFSMAQLEDYKDLTACVFCRVHSAEKTMSSITGFLSDKSEVVQPSPSSLSHKSDLTESES